MEWINTTDQVCHYCKNKSEIGKSSYNIKKCNHYWCGRCLLSRFSVIAMEITNGGTSWSCAACDGRCSCTSCIMATPKYRPIHMEMPMLEDVHRRSLTSPAFPDPSILAKRLKQKSITMDTFNLSEEDHNSKLNEIVHPTDNQEIKKDDDIYMSNSMNMSPTYNSLTETPAFSSMLSNDKLQLDHSFALAPSTSSTMSFNLANNFNSNITLSPSTNPVPKTDTINKSDPMPLPVPQVAPIPSIVPNPLPVISPPSSIETKIANHTPYMPFLTAAMNIKAPTSEPMGQIKQRLANEEKNFESWINSVDNKYYKEVEKVLSNGVGVALSSSTASKLCNASTLIAYEEPGMMFGNMLKKDDLNAEDEQSEKDDINKKQLITLVTSKAPIYSDKKEYAGLYLFLDSRQFPFRLRQTNKTFGSNSCPGSLLLLLSSTFKLIFLVVPEDYRDISLSKIRAGSVLWIKDSLETKGTYSCSVNQFPSLNKPENNLNQRSSYMPYMYNNTSTDNSTANGTSTYLMPVTDSHLSILQTLALKHPELLICNTHMYCANNSAYAIVTNKENKKFLLFAFSLISPKPDQSNSGSRANNAPFSIDTPNVNQSSIPQSSTNQAATEYYQNYYSQCVYAANAAQAQYSIISNQLPSIAKNTPTYTALIAQATHLYAQYQQLSSQAQLAMMHARQSIQATLPNANSGFKSLTSSTPTTPQLQRSNSESTVLSALRASSPAKHNRNDAKLPFNPDNSLQPEVPICSSSLNPVSGSISMPAASNSNKDDVITKSNSDSSKMNLFSRSPKLNSSTNNQQTSSRLDIVPTVKSVNSSPTEKSNNTATSNLAIGLQNLKKHFSVVLEKFSKSPSIQAMNSSPPFASVNVSASPSFSSITPNENIITNSAAHTGMISKSPAFFALKNHKTPQANSLINDNYISPASSSTNNNISLSNSAPTPLLGSVNWSPALSSSNFANSLTALQMRMHPTSASLSRMTNQNLPFLLSSPNDKVASPKFNSEVTSQILNILSNSPALGGLIHNDDQQWSMLESSPEIQMALQLVANSDDINSAEVLELLNEVGLVTQQNKNNCSKDIKEESIKKDSSVKSDFDKNLKRPLSLAAECDAKLVHEIKESRKTKEKSESDFICFSHKHFDVIVSTEDAIPLLYTKKSCNLFVLEPSGKITKNFRLFMQAEALLNNKISPEDKNKKIKRKKPISKSSNDDESTDSEDISNEAIRKRHQPFEKKEKESMIPEDKNVWVKCDNANCLKWRYVDRSILDEVFYCGNNSSINFNACNVLDDYLIKSIGKKLANTLSDAGIKTIEQLKCENSKGTDVEKYLAVLDRLDLYFDGEKNEIKTKIRPI